MSLMPIGQILFYQHTVRVFLSYVAPTRGVNQSAAFIERCNQAIRDSLLNDDYEFIYRAQLAYLIQQRETRT